MIPAALAILSNQEDCALKTKSRKSQLKSYIIPFDDRPAKEHKIYKLVNNEKDYSNGKVSQEMKRFIKGYCRANTFTCHPILFPKVREKRKISNGKHIGRKYFGKSDQQGVSPKRSHNTQSRNFLCSF